MSKSYRTSPLDAPIMECLSDGEKRNHEIYEAVEGSVSSIKKRLRVLEKHGEITNPDRGKYALPEPPVEVQDAPVAVENSRSETENMETINKLLKSYDIVLDNIAETLESELAAKATIEEKINLIKSLRWLGATVDQLMKRWYLVHRGYDANTRQAQEDAKKKTAEREKTALETSPPEDQVVVVAEYHTSVRGIWDTLPEPEKKRHTV